MLRTPLLSLSRRSSTDAVRECASHRRFQFRIALFGRGQSVPFESGALWSAPLYLW